jgi:hypothetical protein
LHKLFARRPSAAMLVAVTALVSSLTGPAIADEVARIAQSITSSQQIRTGAVNGADVRNESLTGGDILNGSLRTEDIGTAQVTAADIATDAVRGDKILSDSIDDSDIQDNTLRGADILEASLGQVPSAGRADLATKADSAVKADSATVADTAASADQATQADRATVAESAENVITFNTTIPVGDDVTLGTSGAVSVIGSCRGGGPNPTEAYVIAETTKTGSYLTSFDSRDADFGPATPEGSRRLRNPGAADGGGGRTISDASIDDVGVGHPDGEELAGNVQTIADDGAGTCLFTGYLIAR